MEIAGSVAGDKQDEPQSRGRWPKGVSGNPSGQHVVEQLSAELYESMRADFDHLNAVDEALLRQACLLLARASRPKCEPDACIRMTATAHRIISSLRKHAAPAAARTAPNGMAALQAQIAARYGPNAVPDADDDFDDAAAEADVGEEAVAEPAASSSCRRRPPSAH